MGRLQDSNEETVVCGLAATYQHDYIRSELRHRYNVLTKLDSTVSPYSR